MLAWIAFYVGLTAATWTALWPMFRMPKPKMYNPPVVLYDVPNTTFDSGGLF